MIDGSEKRNGWLNFERQSPHVIERRSKVPLKKKSFVISYQCSENTNKCLVLSTKLIRLFAHHREIILTTTADISTVSPS